jgi:diguanylate cyclase (GGDEF)-like protein
LEYKAQHDALTGLFNREYLNELIRCPSQLFGYCAFIDLDGFKAVNDLHGHHVGDLLLVRVTEICRSLALKGDILIRNGGDEFIDLCPKHRELIELQLMLEQILDRLSALTNIAGAAIKIGASIGLAQAYSEVSLTELVKAADMMMYKAKMAGKQRLQMTFL